MIPGDLLELHVRQVAQSFRRKSQHICRNITADPPLTERRDVFANSANPATNLQDDITRMNANRLLQGTEGRCSTRQQLCLFRRSSDVNFARSCVSDSAVQTALYCDRRCCSLLVSGVFIYDLRLQYWSACARRIQIFNLRSEPDWHQIALLSDASEDWA